MPADVEAVSTLRQGAVTAGSNFTPDNAGFTAWTVSFAQDPGDEPAGRLLQMILEIETYRTLAVMGMDRIELYIRFYSALQIIYHARQQRRWNTTR